MPANPKKVPGFIDREMAANKLQTEVPEGESSGEEEEEPSLLEIATGAKTKTGATTNKAIHPSLEKFLVTTAQNQESTEHLLVESMNAREQYQANQIDLAEKRNQISLERNLMLERFVSARVPVQEVSIMDNSQKFSTCLELKDLKQVTQDVAEYMGLEATSIKGLLRSFQSNSLSLLSRYGQKVTRATQLFTSSEITVNTILIEEETYIQFSA